jgi:membrane associated rhomboid family serine protease
LETYIWLEVGVMVLAVALAFFKRFSLTQMLVLGNFGIFLIEVFTSVNNSIFTLGFRPIYLQTGDSLYTLLTNLFVHSSALHVIGNMLFLLLIGMALEERVGKVKFGAVYFVAGVTGTLMEAVVRWGSYVPIVGASGAIAGAVGAMLILYPRDRIPFFVGPIFIPNVQAWIAGVSFFAFQLFMDLIDHGGNVAYTAHLGGFVFGIVAALLIPTPKKREVTKVVSVDGLEPLANTPELRNALEKARHETQPDVRKAWLEHFASHAKCPKCGGRMELKGSRVKCTSCDFEVSLK